MQENLTTKDMLEWEAYSILEPFGSLSDYYRMGVIASILVNVNTTKDSKRAIPSDFFLPGMEDPEVQEKPMDPISMHEALKALFPQAVKRGRRNKKQRDNK